MREKRSFDPSALLLTFIVRPSLHHRRSLGLRPQDHSEADAGRHHRFHRAADRRSGSAAGKGC